MHNTTRLLAIMLLLLSSSSYAFKLPESFLAEYRLEKYNTTIAEMSLQLSRQDNHYTYRSVTQPYGMAALFSSDQVQETSTLYQNDNQTQLYLSSYEFKRKDKNNKNQHIDLKWSEQYVANINGVYGDKKFELKHQGILWDRLSIQLALIEDIKRSTDIPTGHSFTYNIIDRNKISEYRFSYEGKQNIQLGKYHYNTIKLKRQHGSSDKVTIFWLARELDFIPVKVEHYRKSKLHMSMELSQFTRQKP